MSDRKQTKWSNDYISKAYDRVNLTLKKGERAQLQEYVKRMQEKYPDHAEYFSVNSFISFAIKKAMNEVKGAD